MTPRPRRLRPDSQQRTKTILTQTKGAPSAHGSVAAARPVDARRTARTYQAGSVITGDSTGTGSVSITSTVSGAGTSKALTDRSVAVGDSAQAGDTGTDCTAVGPGAFAGGYGSTAVGPGTLAGADNTLSLGNGASASQAGGAAIGTDSGGTGALSSAVDEIALGTGNHRVTVAGRLNVAPRTPSGTADTQGVVGDMTSDDSYVYAKTSAGWKRAALSTF